MTFSERAWEDIAPIYGAILDHPFIRELAGGTLSTERFRFYMVQDALYLAAFSRVLSLIADGAPDGDTTARFEEYARTALIVEQALHETFFERFGIAGEAAARSEMTPTCLAYTGWLLATAHEQPFAVSVAAVQPCFRIYWEVGRHIQAGAASDNPYQLWIDTYGDESFGEAVRAVMATADRAAESAAPEVRDAMLRAFRRASRLEWMFWDSAYRLDGWPV